MTIKKELVLNDGGLDNEEVSKNCLDTETMEQSRYTSGTVTFNGTVTRA